MADRVSTEAKGDPDRLGRSFGCKRRRIAKRSDNCNATADEVSHERRQAIVLAAEPMVLDGHVLALNVAGFAEAFRERGRMASGAIERSTADKADYGHRRLLRARRERPRSRRAAEQRDERAPPHSITSSARARTGVGISRPRAFAVLTLMTSSYLVGACTGRSVGFSPRRMRST
jgi:hypothetical protein